MIFDLIDCLFELTLEDLEDLKILFDNKYTSTFIVTSK